MRRMTFPVFRGIFAAVTAVGMCACGASPITPSRIEQAIAPTFANLVQLQVSWLGLASMAAAQFNVTASCRKAKMSAGASNAGSGDWTCTLRWKGPDGQALRDTFELFVTSDGCYTATAAGETLGGPTLRSPDNREVRNLLYAFDGCFDTM
jgi:hypothetical protein